MPHAILFEKPGFAGCFELVKDDTPSLQGDLNRSSEAVTTDNELGWTVFWASRDYDADEDSLWVEGTRGTRDPNLCNLATLPRPHGNHHWADRIRAVSFSDTPPSGNHRNRTIYFRSGRLVCGVPRKRLDIGSKVLEATESGR